MEALYAGLHVLFILTSIVAGLVAIIAPSTLVVRLILSPIDRAAKFRNAPPRFSVGDFLCLFLAIQIPLSAISRFVEPNERYTFWLFTVATWIIGPLMWVTSARTISKAGVVTGSHRLVFMGLVMPVVYYGLLPFTILSVDLVIIAFSGEDPRTPIGWVFITWSALAVLLILSRAFTNYMLRHVEWSGLVLDSRLEAEKESTARPNARCNRSYASSKTEDIALRTG
jgi:hypothetical protein